MKWISTGVDGAFFKNIEMPDGSFSIAITGLQPQGQRWKIAVELGFRASTSGRILLRRDKLRFNDARAIFSGASIADVQENEVFVFRRERPRDRSLVADTQASILLGQNYLGQSVYVTQTGSRYIKTGNDDGLISEDAVMIPSAFLRARGPDDLGLCADGFVARANNEYLRPEDVRRLCAIVYGEVSDKVEPSDPRLRDVQEAIEAAANRSVARNHQRYGDIARTYQFATHLIERLPSAIYRTSLSVELQQYSTPITMSIAAQYVLGDLTGRRVLEPTIGNASLLSTVSGASIVGVEKDAARFDHTKSRIGGDLSGNEITLVRGDFLTSDIDGEFDAVIANPPFGGLDHPVSMSGLHVTRIDHQILMRSLDLRKPEGRSVFIIGADRENIVAGNEGRISGGSRRLMNWLSDHYETFGFEVSGGLYTKQGAGYPTRLIAVGKKRSQSDADRAMTTKEFRIDSFEVAKSPDELWVLASAARESLRISTIPDVVVSAGPSDAPTETEATTDVQVQPGNDYQAQYVSMSAGNTVAMVPRNLLAPQQVAFQRFMDECGDPIEYVKKELQWDDADIADLAPEQIDAVALGIWNIKRGRALILADQTGMGKGRVVAAIARWSALNQVQTNFLTEKDSLMSDIWRDITDIGSQSLFTPLIMNDDVPISSMDGDEQTILIPKTAKQARQAVIESGVPTIESGYNMMMATYSQFNRDTVKSAKARYIQQASTDAVLLLDESHNAAGDSNTGRNITNAIISAMGGIYSSATYAKNANNMSVYYKAFPKSINLESLTETLKSGGEPLLEITSAMLCADGVFLRRESDLSGLKFRTIDVPDDYLERNVRVSDQVSSVLAQIAHLSGDTDRVARRVSKQMAKKLDSLSADQRKGKRIGVAHTNFGSRLYSISRQMALVLGADLVAKSAIEALQSGQKPVIALEQTMESIVSEIGVADVEGDDGEIVENKSGSISPLMVKDLLARLLKKVTAVVVTDDYGESTKESIFTIGTADEAAAAREIVYSLEMEIDAMDDVIAMPLDIIRSRIEDAGYSCGEISGRGHTYSFGEDGLAVPQEREVSSRAKNDSIFRFNSGDTDALIISRSGCTGISLHASEKFSDQRQRVLIEAQIAANVSERMQFFGRVNRRGQVSSPEIWSITSGLPWENRILAMQNVKIRRLSANTQSNRNSSVEMKNIPDILNAIGNDVCKDFLINNPDTANALGITGLGDDDEKGSRSGEDGCFYANKLTGLICLLPIAEQNRIYDDLTDEYNTKIEDLNNKGINPLDSKVSDYRARVTSTVEVSGRGATSSAFDDPVYAEKIEWDEDIKPIRTEGIVRFSNASSDTLLEKYPEYFSLVSQDFNLQSINQRLEFGSRARSGYDLRCVDVSGLCQRISESALVSMRKFVPEDIDTPEGVQDFIKSAIESDETTFIKRIDQRVTWLTGNLQSLMPGCPVNVSGEFGAESAIIVDLRVNARPGQEHLLGKYHIRLAFPGKNDLVEMSFAGLADDAKFSTNCFSYRGAYAGFDSTPGGQITFSRWTLTGNLFGAVEMLQRNLTGRFGVYTMADGSRRRGVICAPSVNLKDVMGAEITLSTTDAIAAIKSEVKTRDRGYISLDHASTRNQVVFSWDNGSMRVSVPGTKAAGGLIFMDEGIKSAVGEFSGTRSAMSARFVPSNDMSEIDTLVRVVYQAGFAVRRAVSVKPASDDTPDDTPPGGAPRMGSGSS